MILKKIKESVQILKSGGVILYPTDTIWGIGCDATKKKSIEKIYKIKNRPKKKPLILLVNNTKMLSEYVEEVPEEIIKILNKNNEPTTIVYPNPKKLPKILTKTNTIAIRVTNDYFCSEIIKKLKKPIISTSANISREKNPKNFKEINNKIKKMVDYIVNHKIDLNLEKPSRIIKINSKNTIEFIR
tara:strand:+ start:534 stop:1091 length:558 start_codon:yes stop_codon:yes gene_type:complete